MSRFKKLSHAIWHCKYHLVWTPKYRFRILDGEIKEMVDICIRTFSEYKHVEILELGIQQDHVHIVVMVPPKISISDYVGIIKGRTAIRIFNKFKQLKEKQYWGNHFWSRGYCVDTVGLNEEMIRKYVQYQEKKERQMELFKK
jgi:putative transposase